MRGLAPKARELEPNRVLPHERKVLQVMSFLQESYELTTCIVFEHRRYREQHRMVMCISNLATKLMGNGKWSRHSKGATHIESVGEQPSESQRHSDAHAMYKIVWGGALCDILVMWFIWLASGGID